MIPETRVKKQVPQITNQMRLDQKFNTFILNVNHLDTLYSDYFKSPSHFPGTTPLEKQSAQLELKNRCFKDLYNLVEESVTKVFELYLDYQA